MPVVAATTSPPGPLDRPAGSAFTLIFTTLPALLRLTCGLAGAVVALAVRTPPVRVALLAPVVAVLTAWSVWYAVRALRHGIGPALVAGDVALTTVAAAAIPWLVAPEVLPGEGSWIAVLASTTVINAQATAPARWSVPAALLVIAGYVGGAAAAGNPVEARGHAATLLVQTACTAMTTAVMRQRIGRADAAFADYHRLARAAMVARTAREAERRQNRDLHDTVLATLTMVGLGAVSGPSAALRERCAADLRTLAALADARTTPAAGPVALDDRLRAVLARTPELTLRPRQRGASRAAPRADTVAATLEPCTVPAEVADALADSAAAALANVARHAPGASAELRLTRIAGTVVVEVSDDGPGFDPATVPAHRYGLRESIHGRMSTVGGRAVVTSAPGAGTRIRLEWPGVH
ncbi:sensor histidine kinase [Micromonospora sp. NPDC048930]|uniref:sensor histidine kinase n=1 Tax=Micromonospora sp. NPDC048930 TaxID=3364261 RepID=UPI0037224A31